MPTDSYLLFSGNANPALAKKVAKQLHVPLGKITVGRFSDGEIMVEILENVRGREVFIIQPICHPVNDTLMELIIMADAFRRSSASKITAVVPYYGYARQDRRVRSSRVPITAKVVADMMATVGISRLITVDLHAEQIQGFFYMPVDNIYPSPVILADLFKKRLDNPLVVSPDIGGVVRARAIAKRLNDTDLAIIDKRRPEANQAQVLHIIGDVKNRNCIIVDDIVDTAGTLCKAAEALKKAGAKSVTAYCTHPILSGKALENLSSSGIDELVVSDSIPLSAEAQKSKKIRVLSISPIVAETISRIMDNSSVSSMFTD